jgi:protein-S-isoprenylcysteine O-methyltransferase Ste14
VAEKIVEQSMPFRLDAGTVQDWIMRLPVVGWFGYMGVNMAFGLGRRLLVTDYAALDLAKVADLVDRSMYVFFMLMVAGLALLRRRPVAAAPGLYPKIVAFLGTFLVLSFAFFPQLEPTGAAATVRNLVSASLIAAGDLFAIYVLVYLGRSFSIMAEARHLVGGGPYRRIRHPLYLAEEFAIIGIWLRVASPLSFALLVCHALLQIKRMQNEEGVLGRTFPGYAAYMGRTARLVPGVY